MVRPGIPCLPGVEPWVVPEEGPEEPDFRVAVRCGRLLFPMSEQLPRASASSSFQDAVTLLGVSCSRPDCRQSVCAFKDKSLPSLAAKQQGLELGFLSYRLECWSKDKSC